MAEPTTSKSSNSSSSRSGSTTGSGTTIGKTGAETPTPDACGGTSGFITMMVMLFSLFIMFDQGLRLSIAQSLDVVFEPMFAFDYQFPTLTLLAASLFLVFCSTTIRHFMTDWIGQARAQKIMNAYNKEKTNAMMAGNTVKLKKLEEFAPEIQNYQMTLMTTSFKPLAYTMIFFIVVFPWIWAIYIERLTEAGYVFVSLPGTAKWDLTTPLEWCFVPTGSWLLIYILLSFPIGFLLQNGLKYITFSMKIRKAEVERDQVIEDDINTLEVKLDGAHGRGISVDRSRELLNQARDNLEEKKYTRASKLITEAEENLGRRVQANERVNALFAEAESMIKNAEQKNIGVAKARKSLDNAKNAMKRNDDTSAIYYAKESQRKVKEARKQHKEADETLSSLKAYLYDLRDMKTEEADAVFSKAQTAMEKKEYSDVIKYSKSTKTKAHEIKALHKEASDALATANNARDSIKHLGLHIDGIDGILDRAKTAMKNHRYKDTVDHANKVIESINSEKTKFQEAQESVSFAKLVMSNAQTFGADVSESQKLVTEAEIALTKKQYDRTIDLANRAKDIAEQQKRQHQRASKRK
jgi:uncharacterized membrane protein (DUF106 family)